MNLATRLAVLLLLSILAGHYAATARTRRDWARAMVFIAWAVVDLVLAVGVMLGQPAGANGWVVWLPVVGSLVWLLREELAGD